MTAGVEDPSLKGPGLEAWAERPPPCCVHRAHEAGRAAAVGRRGRHMRRPELPPGEIALQDEWVPASEDADAAPSLEVRPNPKP